MCGQATALSCLNPDQYGIICECCEQRQRMKGVTTMTKKKTGMVRQGDVLLLPVEATRRVYHVPCDPRLRPLLADHQTGEPQKMTCLAAVASTYGMRAEEYVLSYET